jgi:DNA-binding MarR family transcriptional regulator
MTSQERFTHVLREWSEVFMHRSVDEFTRFMDESGLSASQIHALMRLYHTAEGRGACRVSELGGHLGISNAASSQMVDRMVQQGLLQRTEDAYDRRVKQVALTPQGRALIEEGIETRRSWMEGLTTALTPDEQQAIIDALTLLTHAARQVMA